MDGNSRRSTASDSFDETLKRYSYSRICLVIRSTHLQITTIYRSRGEVITRPIALTLLAHAGLKFRNYHEML